MPDANPGLPAPPRTLLVYSAPEGGGWMDFLPIGMGYLQAMLASRGFPCRLANLGGMTKREVLTYFRRQRPDVLGVSMFTFNRRRSAELLAWAREACPEALLLAGGPHPTHLPEEVFAASPALDALVQGEGERTLLALVEGLRRGSEEWRNAPGLRFRDGRATPRPAPIEDLDSIGLPARHFEADFTDPASELGHLSTSRGCPARCAFCSTPEFWGSRMRFRSPASVVEEMRLLQERCGLTYFSVRDDTFTARKERVLELADGLRASGLHPLWNCQSRVNLVDEERLVALKRAGCEFIQFGVEHASPRILESLDKGTDPGRVREALALVRRVGLNLGIYLITGIPGEEEADLQASLELVRELRPHDVQVSPLAVYPGTRIYERGRAEGRFGPEFFRTHGDLEVLARPGAFTDRALARLQRAASEARARARYTPADFAAQERLLGWCATTELLRGEAAEETGHLADADAAYTGLIQREPGNTWGFLKRALLRERQGRRAQAREDLREVLRLVPRNPEALELAEAWGLPA